MCFADHFHNSIKERNEFSIPNLVPVSVKFLHGFNFLSSLEKLSLQLETGLLDFGT